jgi:glycerate dehydrogenase
MAKVVVTFSPSEAQRKMIESTLNDVVFLGEDRSVLASADVVFSWNPVLELKGEELAGLNARFMQTLSAGVDHVPIATMPDNVAIASNVGAYAEPMAEHTMAMFLALAKRLYKNHQRMKEVFDQWSMTRTMKDSVCGILGFGENGKAVARLVSAFGARIYAINSTGRTEEDVDFIGTLKDLDLFLKNVDFLAITIALNNKTRGILGKRELELMKKNAILVNTARGEIIDEEALYEHLESNPEFMAGIDAWWVEPFRHGKFEMRHPFLDLPNVIGSPHNSAMVEGAVDHATELACENIEAFIEGKKVRGVVRRDDYV